VALFKVACYSLIAQRRRIRFRVTSGKQVRRGHAKTFKRYSARAHFRAYSERIDDDGIGRNCRVDQIPRLRMDHAALRFDGLDFEVRFESLRCAFAPLRFALDRRSEHSRSNKKMPPPPLRIFDRSIVMDIRFARFCFSLRSRVTAKLDFRQKSDRLPGISHFCEAEKCFANAEKYQMLIIFACHRALSPMKDSNDVMKIQSSIPRESASI